MSRASQLGSTALLALALSAGHAPLACESDYRAIRSISIAEQAAHDADVPAAVCQSFRLSERQVRRFLRRAREVVVRHYAAALDRAPCRVTGALTLENGLTGTWEIEMSGRGRIAFEDQHITLLHCAHCSGPFAR